MVTTMGKSTGLMVKLAINYITESSTKTITTRGDVHWRDKDGELHRDGGPAVIEVSGTEMWLKHGRMHRDDGPAVVHYYGDKLWYRDGKLHREDGPACTYRNGTKEWYRDGTRHRVDGPAVEYPDGLMDQYWVNGQQLTEEEFYLYVDQETGEAFVPPGKKLCWS